MQTRKLIIVLTVFLAAMLIAVIIYFDQINNNKSIEGFKITPNFIQREIAQKEFSYSYKEWKNTYVTGDGVKKSNQLRVKRPENQNDSVSEAIAYGMIFAVHANDKATFEGLWRYVEQCFNQNGLMSWRVSQGGHIEDLNSASDADLDMGYALIAANLKWGKYKNDTDILINNIMEHDIEKDTFVLKPSDNWGGSDVTNPSYFSPAYFELFGEFSNDQRWNKVAEKSREILSKANVRELAFPDWVSAEGENRDLGNEQSRYYEAIRIPWRQAMGALWYSDKDEIAKPAFTQLKIANSFFKNNQSLLSSSCFVSSAVNASLSSKDEDYKKDLFRKLIDDKNKGYYHDSLRLLTLLLFTNKMIH